MEGIIDKIYQQYIDDSEIIQDFENIKNNPEFNINWIPECKLSLLMFAVIRNREELVRYLLSYPSIDVNYRYKYGDTVLFFCDQICILKLLLGHRDIDVNIQDNWEDTRLHEICYDGIEACVREYLLDARVNTFIRNKGGETARDIALMRGYPGIAKIINNSKYTLLLRIPNKTLCMDIVRMIIEEYT